MKHLTTPQPLISEEQAEQDRVAFLESAEEWRKERNRQRSRKSEAKARKAREPERAEKRRRREAKFARAAELRSQGWPDKAICKELGVGHTTLVKYLGPPPRTIGNCEAKIEEAAELRELGWSDTAICKQLHIGRQTLVEHLGPPPQKPTQKLPPAERQKKQATATQLLQNGLNYSQIAERVGVSKQSVRNWFLPPEREAA